MKKMNALTLAGAALLVACGGAATDEPAPGAEPPAPAGTSSPPAPALPTEAGSSPNAAEPVALTVAAVPAPQVTTADCDRLGSEARSVAALDLSNASVRAVNDFVLKVDPEHAYGVFIRRPEDFVNWIAANGAVLNLLTLGVATHETLHMTDAVLRRCAPPGYRTLFFGSILDSGLQANETASIQIVDGELDAALKTEPRYATYILNAAAGNDFTVLLDEFAAYTGAAHTTLRAQVLGTTGGTKGVLDADLGGTVTFMVFLESYLKAARLNDAATYERIRGSSATRLVIQTLWSAAEQVLRDAYPFVQGGHPQLRVNLAYFASAFSPAGLAELDALGTAHATAAAWSSTYLP